MVLENEGVTALLGFAPVIAPSANGIANTLNMRSNSGIQLPRALDSLALSGFNCARPRGSCAPHGVVTLGPLFYIDAMIFGHDCFAPGKHKLRVISVVRPQEIEGAGFAAVTRYFVRTVKWAAV